MRELYDLGIQILNENRSEMRRALDLYELQTGAFLPSQVKRARKYCAMMLLDYIERRDNIRRGDLARAASQKDYCELFGEVMRQRGWMEFSQLKPFRGFQIKLSLYAQYSRIDANSVDLVCRAAQQGQDLRFDLAQQVSLSSIKDMKIRGSNPGKLQQRITEGTILAYVLLDQCSELLPPSLKYDGFAEQLLEQTRDHEATRLLFSTYNQVLALLQPSSPRLPSNVLLDGFKPIQWKPLDLETKELIKYHILNSPFKSHPSDSEFLY
jgi:hypothetical protein